MFTEVKLEDFIFHPEENCLNFRPQFRLLNEKVQFDEPQSLIQPDESPYGCVDNLDVVTLDIASTHFVRQLVHKVIFVLILSDLCNDVQRINDAPDGQVQGCQGVCPFYWIFDSKILHLLRQPHLDIVVHVVDKDVYFGIGDPIVVLLLHLAVIKLIYVVSDGSLEGPAYSSLRKNKCQELGTMQFFALCDVYRILLHQF